MTAAAAGTGQRQGNAADLGYTWWDLRQRRIGDLEVGSVVVTLVFPSAYWTGGPDGQIASAFGMTPCGFAWTITDRDGDNYTAVRHDQELEQVVQVDPDQVVLAVVKNPPLDPPAPRPRIPDVVIAAEDDLRRQGECGDPIHPSDPYVGTCSGCGQRVGARPYRFQPLTFECFSHRQLGGVWCRGVRGMGAVDDVEPVPGLVSWQGVSHGGWAVAPLHARPDDLDRWIEAKFTEGWRTLSVHTAYVDSVEVAGIAPDPHTGQRTWWATPSGRDRFDQPRERRQQR